MLSFAQSALLYNKVFQENSLLQCQKLNYMVFKSEVKHFCDITILVKLILTVGDSRNGCQHFESISICFNWVYNYFSTTNQSPYYNCNYQIMERLLRNFVKQDLVKILLKKNL